MRDKEVSDPLHQIERLLGRVEKAHPDQQSVVAEIKELVRSLTDRPRPSPRRRTGEETTYSVEGTGGHATLAEYRPSGQPLRVPRHAYDLVVDVLAAADRPLPFDEIMNAMAKSATPPADWQTRVILRFLLHAKPEIIRRARSRYQLILPKTVKRAADKWWKAAATT